MDDAPLLSSPQREIQSAARSPQENSSAGTESEVRSGFVSPVTSVAGSPGTGTPSTAKASSDALFQITELSGTESLASARSAVPKSVSIISVAIFLLLAYLIVGIFIYWFFRDEFSGTGTNPIVDGIYFTTVTFLTVGYGDIVPLTVKTKVLTTILVLIGVGCLDLLLHCVVNGLVELQAKWCTALINMAVKIGIRDHGRFTVKWKITVALCCVFICVVIGAMFLYFYEKLGFVDSVYLSVMSVTTVGYGDFAFQTFGGRLFAVIWLLTSTIKMAALFSHVADMRRIDPPMSQSDFILTKLKESQKISDEDVTSLEIEFQLQ